MELLCPVCMGTLVSRDGRTARCTVHGGEFTILFLREPLKVMESPAENLPVISPVPTAPEATVDGAAADGTPALPPAVPVVPPAVPERYPGMRCVQHPALAATRQCQMCGAYMCDTCDFAFPDGVHLCPACATRPQTALGPKRRRALIWSYVCAGGGSVFFVSFLATFALHPVHTQAEQQGVGTAMMLFVLGPAIGGLGCGLGAIDRRHRNPVSLWIATCWNGVIIAVFLLLTIIGLAR